MYNAKIWFIKENKSKEESKIVKRHIELIPYFKEQIKQIFQTLSAWLI